MFTPYGKPIAVPNSRADIAYTKDRKELGPKGHENEEFHLLLDNSLNDDSITLYFSEDHKYNGPNALKIVLQGREILGLAGLPMQCVQFVEAEAENAAGATLNNFLIWSTTRMQPAKDYTEVLKSIRDILAAKEEGPCPAP